MHMLKRAGLLLLAALSTSVLLSGCGGGSSSSNTIPSVVTITNAHNAIFRNNTTLMTAGYNGFGQLGLNDSNLTTDHTTFQVVPGLGGQIRGVSTGAVHTLAFGNASSVVYAWGSNLTWGQLGNPNIPTTGTGAYSQIPSQVPGLKHVISVAAGGFHSLAVVTDVLGGTSGQVRSWGANEFGELGDSTYTSRTSPVQVIVNSPAVLGTFIPLTDVTTVAAGGAHSLALSSSATGARVYAWGYNFSGQVGEDPALSPSLQFVPVARSVVAADHSTLQGIKQIAAAGSYSLALSDDGQTLYFWGNDIAFPELKGVYQPAPAPVALPTIKVGDVDTPVITGANPIVKIAAGVDHFLILDSQGDVWAIGFNAFGQLGDGTTTNEPVTFVDNSIHPFYTGPENPPLNNKSKFVQVMMTSTTPLSGVTDITAFGSSSFALVNGVWYGWGDNGHGQLGNDISTSLGYKTSPIKVRGAGL